MKKAQSSIEFMVLLGFAILLTSLMLVVLNSDSERRLRAQNEALVNEVFNLIDTEIRIAITTPANYTREFFLPSLIGGKEYELNLIDNRDIVVNFNNNDYVLFTNTTIQGHLLKGTNTISKTCITQFTCQIRFN